MKPIKITVEGPKEKSLQITLPIDAPIEYYVETFRTIMVHLTWHPDVAESIFNKETLEDYGI
jgi:hypothetical protein